jgi:hypothetical protein
MTGVLSGICTLIGERRQHLRLGFIDRKPDYFRLLIEVDLRDVEHMHIIMTALLTVMSPPLRGTAIRRAGQIERQG